VIPPLLDASSPLRSSHLRDPVGPQIQFGSEQFHRRAGRRAGEDRRVPAEIRHRFRATRR